VFVLVPDPVSVTADGLAGESLPHPATAAAPAAPITPSAARRVRLPDLLRSLINTSPSTSRFPLQVPRSRFLPTPTADCRLPTADNQLDVTNVGELWRRSQHFCHIFKS
jgi:hypothetical protein